MENATLEISPMSTCSMYSELLQGLQPFWIAYFVIAINVVLIITAILGNVLILIALQDSLLHSPSKMLFRCLTSTDLCVGLITQPCFVTYLISEISGLLSVCYVTERLVHISSAILCGISLGTLTGISVDRLLALQLGLRYRQIVTLTHVRGIAILSWVLFSSLSMLYFWNPYCFMVTFCTIILLFLVASTLCYSKIYFTLRSRQTQVCQQSEPGEPNLLARGRMFKYKKSVTSSTWVYLTLIVCYLPFAIVQIVRGDIYGESLSIILAEGSTISLVYLNSSINPAIYCWRIKEIRQAVKRTIRHFCFFCY